MRTFKINESTVAECSSYSTRNTWGHKARIIQNGTEICSARIRYYNRTWERYQYQSVLAKVLEKSGLMTDKEVHEFTNQF